MLTVERLREVLSYNKETGLFVWITRAARRIQVGDIAGKPHGAGYISIGIDGQQYLTHRLAWLWMTGEWPWYQIDHVNRIRVDNRWDNLRSATPVQNNANAGLMKTNTSGRKGVTWFKRDSKWRAQISIDNWTRHIGYYDTLDEAHAAYAEEARKIRGEYANV